MTIRCSLAIDGIAQFEAFLDCTRTHVEQSVDFLCNFGIRERYMGCAVGIYVEAHRSCDANGVCHLHEYTVGHTCCHKILGYVTGCIGCRAVDLRGVLS